jgi:hypothetical protein
MVGSDESVYGSTALMDLRPLFRYLINKQSVGLLLQGINQAYLHTEQHKQSKRTLLSMLRVGFEHMTPAFEQGKTVHALDRAATGIGWT